MKNRLHQSCLAVLWMALSVSGAMAESLSVTTASDVADGNTSSIADLLATPGPDGKISLREAMLATNAAPGPDIIKFSASGTVVLSSALPPLSGGGTSVLGGGDIVLDGNGLAASGLQVTSADNVASGLHIANFHGTAIVITGAGATGNIIEECVIGPTTAKGGGLDGNFGGIDITAGARNNLIGQPGAGNYISGNGGVGIYISGSGTRDNLVRFNVIGLDNLGNALPNGASGIAITGGSDNNIIGGVLPAESNVISGNTLYGVYISGNGVTGNQVLGNEIGTNVVGLAARPNGLAGVAVDDGASGNEIGGAEASTGNLISGNLGEGVLITGVGTANNRVRANRIGTRISGTVAMGNGTGADAGDGDGVRVENGATDNLIGGANETLRNLIAGNADDGVELRGSDTSGNTVAANLIGVNLDGSAALPNGGDGVKVAERALSNIVGGESAAEGNLISGNTGVGVRLIDTEGNQVLSNGIGVNLALATAIPNASGVLIEDAAASNVIGNASSGNLISGNSANGIELNGLDVTLNVIKGNRIGTGPSGLEAIPNGGNGVYVSGGATQNTFGGNIAGEGNQISGNGGAGILLFGANSGSNTVLGNTIGASIDGAALSNSGDGITINGAPGNTIGGSADGAGNLIAYNGNDGIEVTGGSATGNRIRGNSIRANVGDGIKLALGGNSGIAAPVVLTSNPITGTAQPFSEVDLFADAEDEGGTFIASATTSGDGTFTSGASVSAYEGLNITATVTGPSGNSSAFSNGVAVPDLTAPVITLLGGPTLTVECGNLTPDPMVEVTDNVDTDIRERLVVSVIGFTTLNALKNPGIYTLRYNVMDLAGNAAGELQRPMSVVDTLPPELTVNARTEYSCFEDFENNSTAIDQCDGNNVTIRVEGFDSGSPGEQTVTIVATDHADVPNSASEDLTVTVSGALPGDIHVDNQSPAAADAPGHGTPDAPFLTIGYAMDQARCLASTADRMVIRVAAGDYPETVELADHTRLIGAGQGLTNIVPDDSDFEPLQPVAVAGGDKSAIESLTIALLSNAAPSDVRMISVTGLMAVRDVEIHGNNASDSKGVYIRGAASSGSLIKDCRIRSVEVGLDIASSAARFAFNDFDDISGDAAIRVFGTLGEAIPRIGSTADLVFSGSNTFSNLGSSTKFINTNNPALIVARANAWSNLSDLGNILSRVAVSLGAGGADVSSPLFTLDAAKGQLTSTAFVSLLDADSGAPVEGASVTIVPTKAAIPESGSPGLYSATIAQGQYTFRAIKSGYWEQVQLQAMGQGANAFTMRMSAVGGNGAEQASGSGEHTGDTNHDGAFDLSETLRVVQLYNGGSFSCGTDLDGYQIGPAGGQGCSSHAADYAGGAPDWNLGLSELLRVVQFFTNGGYHACEGTEDGYCAGGA